MKQIWSIKICQNSKKIKKKYQRDRYHDPRHNEYLKQYQKIYDSMKKRKKWFFFV